MRLFAVVLTCMDGRVQVKGNNYFSTTFGARNIDTVTAPGMVKYLADATERTSQILSDLRISIHEHGSAQIGVVAHADCAGNPVPDSTQKRQVSEAVAFLRTEFPGAEIAGIWVSEHSIVERIL